MNLRSRAAAGVFWVAVGRVFSRGFSFITTLILARLLVPDDFGLVWMADLAIQALQLLQELGLGSALVYRKDRVEEAADSVFWGVLASSAVLYVVALGAARPVAVLFSKDPATVSQVVPVLRVLALTLVISGFGRVPHSLLARELSFKRKIIPQVLGGILGAGVSITMAVLGYGVWSIVAGRVCQSLASTIAVWPLARWRPRFRYDRSLAGDLFGYAKHVAGSQILVFLITNIDDAVVSRFLGTGALGHYGLAYKLSNMPATEVTRMLTQVMFPAFSLVREDRERLKRAFLKTTRFVSILAIPLSFLIIAFVDDFIFAAYGKPWSAAIAPARWLAVYGLVRSIAVNMGSVLKATGRPKWLLYIATWRLCTMAALLYPVTIRWGIVGVSVLSAIVSLVDFIISVALINRAIGTTASDYVRILGPAVFCAAIATGAAKWLYPHLLFTKSYLALPLAAVVAADIYFQLIWFTHRDLRQLAREFLAEARSKLWPAMQPNRTDE